MPASANTLPEEEQITEMGREEAGGGAKNLKNFKHNWLNVKQKDSKEQEIHFFKKKRVTYIKKLPSSSINYVIVNKCLSHFRHLC